MDQPTHSATRQDRAFGAGRRTSLCYSTMQFQKQSSDGFSMMTASWVCRRTDMGHGVFWLAATEPCNWHLLALAQPPASCRLISRLHGSFGEHFFEGCGCLLGPGAGIGIGAGAGTGTSNRGPDKTRHGPCDPLQAPTKSNSLLRRHSSSPSSPPDSPGEWGSGDFRHRLHQAPRKLGEVPSSSSKNIKFFFLTGRHIIQW